MQQIDLTKIEKAQLLTAAGKKMVALPAYQAMMKNEPTDLLTRAEALGITSAINIIIGMVSDLVGEAAIAEMKAEVDAEVAHA